MEDKNLTKKPKSPEGEPVSENKSGALSAIEIRLNEIIEKAKKSGSITTKEVLDSLEELYIEPEQIDRIYETLDNLGIETVDKALSDILTEDIVPAVSELEEIEELA